MKFPIGTIIELRREYEQIYAAEAGARGIIDATHSEDGFDYYDIIWDRDDPKVNGQQDGLVDCHHVKPYQETPETKEKQFNFSKKLAQKALNDNVSAFLMIAVKNGIPYIITDARSPIEALKIIPDISAVATQLTEACVDSTITAYDTIEKLKKAQDLLDEFNAPDFLDDEDLL